jgi:type IV pilus assembly protein PilM
MATPRFAWGIDVGNRALKAVKLVRDGAGGLRVDDVDVIEHEHILSDAGDNKDTLVTQSLQQFVQRHPEKGGAVSVGVSGQSSFARFIKLPPVERNKIPEIVRFEAIQQIPFPLDDVEWSYQLFQNEGSPDVEVGIFAMRKELVNQHIKNFTDAGLNVKAVQMNPLAVYNAMYYDQRIKGTTMMVDVGAENTDLIIAEGEQVWLRSIPVGGNNFTEALVKQFKLKFPKAEELKRNAATSKYTRQILQAMRPVFDSLVAEIQRSIGFYASVHREARISRVVALGGTFRLPGLMKFLQMQLQLDVQRFDALGAAPPADGRVATLLNDNILSVVGPYGLALQAMGEGKIVSSLLPAAIRRERMWKDKTKWFAATAALFCVGTGLAVGRYYVDYLKYEQKAEDRAKIAAQLAKAEALSKDWSDVEISGAPERTVIASLQSLTKLRDLQAKIVATVDKALPEPNVKPESKRTDRQVVLVNNIVSDYYEDLAPALTKNTSGFFEMTNSEFIAHRKNVAAGAAIGRGMMGAGKAMSLRLNAPLGVPAVAVAADAAAVPAGTKQRGYLMTLTCTTPMTKWTPVAEAVRKALVEATKPSGQEKQAFRIERVEIAEGTPVKGLPVETVRPRPVSQRKNDPRLNGLMGPGGMRRPAGLIGGGFDEELGLRQPRSIRRNPNAPAGAAGRTRPNPNARPEDAAAADEAIIHEMPALNFDQLRQSGMPFDPNQPVKILDPVTGEDATEDSRLTFLVAVVIDPVPPAPPAPPAEGTEPAPAPVESAAAPVATPSANPLAQAQQQAAAAGPR